MENFAFLAAVALLLYIQSPAIGAVSQNVEEDEEVEEEESTPKKKSAISQKNTNDEDEENEEADSDEADVFKSLQTGNNVARIIKQSTNYVNSEELSVLKRNITSFLEKQKKNDENNENEEDKEDETSENKDIQSVTTLLENASNAIESLISAKTSLVIRAFDQETTSKSTPKSVSLDKITNSLNFIDLPLLRRFLEIGSDKDPDNGEIEDSRTTKSLRLFIAAVEKCRPALETLKNKLSPLVISQIENGNQVEALPKISEELIEGLRQKVLNELTQGQTENKENAEEKTEADEQDDGEIQADGNEENITSDDSGEYPEEEEEEDPVEEEDSPTPEDYSMEEEDGSFEDSGTTLEAPEREVLGVEAVPSLADLPALPAIEIPLIDTQKKEEPASTSQTTSVEQVAQQQTTAATPVTTADPTQPASQSQSDATKVDVSTQAQPTVSTVTTPSTNAEPVQPQSATPQPQEAQKKEEAVITPVVIETSQSPQTSEKEEQKKVEQPTVAQPVQNTSQQTASTSATTATPQPEALKKVEPAVVTETPLPQQTPDKVEQPTVAQPVQNTSHQTTSTSATAVTAQPEISKKEEAAATPVVTKTETPLPQQTLDKVEQPTVAQPVQNTSQQTTSTTATAATAQPETPKKEEPAVVTKTESSQPQSQQKLPQSLVGESELNSRENLADFYSSVAQNVQLIDPMQFEAKGGDNVDILNEKKKKQGIYNQLQQNLAESREPNRALEQQFEDVNNIVNLYNRLVSANVTSRGNERLPNVRKERIQVYRNAIVTSIFDNMIKQLQTAAENEAVLKDPATSEKLRVTITDITAKKDEFFKRRAGARRSDLMKSAIASFDSVVAELNQKNIKDIQMQAIGQRYNNLLRRLSQN